MAGKRTAIQYKKPTGKPAPQTPAPQKTQQTAAAQARRPVGGGGSGGGGGGAGGGGTGSGSQNPATIGTPFPGAGPGQFGFIPGGSEGDPNFSFLGKGGEYFSPTRWSVAPAGGNVLAALMGGRAGAGNLGDWTGLGTLFDSGGTGDPLHQSRLSIDKLLGTGGIVDPTQELSKGRFVSNALWDQQAPQQQTFGDWFDVGNLAGASGPLTQRLMGGGAADFGYTGAQGKSALTSQPFKGFQFIQQALQDNPYLDPQAEADFLKQFTDQVGGTATRGAAGNISSALQRAMGQEDTYGKAHHTATELARDTGRLNNDYESQLMSNIDSEAQRSLATQLPEVQAALQAQGLGRSGASQGASGQLMRDILGQAMRDKQQTLAGFAETGRGISANALGQGAQGVLGAIEGSAGRQGQGILAGAQGQFGALEGDAARMAQSIMGAQGQGGAALGRESDRYMGEMDAYLRSILGSESARLQGLQGQAATQSDAQNQFMNLFGMQEQSYDSALQRMLGISEQQRAIEQQRLSGQIQAGLMPLDLMLRLSTGTTAPSYAPQQASNPWANLGPSLVGNLAGPALGGLLGSSAPSALESAMGSWYQGGPG